MLRVKTLFIWTGKAEQAFIAIKSCLACRPILRPPNYEKIAIDASDVAIGASLMQHYDGIDHPVCYYSKNSTLSKKKYSTIEKECLALKSTVETFRIYFDNGSMITVYTDHRPLKFFDKMANNNLKLLWWRLELQQYNLLIKHKPGKENLLADILSRSCDVEYRTL